MNWRPGCLSTPSSHVAVHSPDFSVAPRPRLGLDSYRSDIAPTHAQIRCISVYTCRERERGRERERETQMCTYICICICVAAVAYIEALSIIPLQRLLNGRSSTKRRENLERIRSLEIQHLGGWQLRSRRSCRTLLEGSSMGWDWVGGIPDKGLLENGIP